MKEVILAVSFGSTAPQGRAAIAGVERALAGAGLPLKRAYTSPTIRRLLARGGERVDSLEEALERCRAEGAQRVYLVPTHLIPGLEYESILRTARDWSDRLEVRVSRPLLSDTAGLRAMADILIRRCPALPAHRYLWMGHGTTHPANLIYPALGEVFRLLGREDMLVGTVEGWPDLDALLPLLGAGEGLTLCPLMLTAGEHARNDMAGEDAGSWRSRLTALGHPVTCDLTGLGELEEVQGLYRGRLEALLERG